MKPGMPVHVPKQARTSRPVRCRSVSLWAAQEVKVSSPFLSQVPFRSTRWNCLAVSH